MSEPTVKLPPAAEALLGDFPISEPDFEAQAQAIAARLSSASSEAARSDLLKAPDLAPEPGEPSAPSSVRTAPKSSFAEMARRSVRKKDDEAAQLAKETLAATAQHRRPNAELVARVRAAGRAAATPLPVDSVEETARPSGVVSRAEAPVAPSPAAKREPVHRGTIIGIAGSFVALAACVALFLKTQAPESPSPIAAVSAAHEPAPPTAVASAAAAPPSKPSDVLSPEALGQLAPRAGAEVVRAPPKAAAAPTAGGKSSAKASGAPQAAPPVELAEEDQPKHATPSPAVAKLEPEPALKPAEGSSGSVPLTPSAGAVSTALGAVRSGAQACLAGQSEPVSATITFAADGRVLRVSAGGPAGACIQAALAKARIAPFARETFSASTTVRPP